jgi:hypothetical protein
LQRECYAIEYRIILFVTINKSLIFLALVCSNTDKMSDEEKLPIAIAGIAFIVLPFLAGMVALYAAK